MVEDRPINPTLNSDYIISRDERILITGCSGFIGSNVVEALLEFGFTNLRCFVRPSSRLERLKQVLSRFSFEKNVEVVTGDLLSQAHCREGSRGSVGCLSSCCRYRKVVCRCIYEFGFGYTQSTGRFSREKSTQAIC